MNIVISSGELITTTGGRRVARAFRDAGLGEDSPPGTRGYAIRTSKTAEDVFSNVRLVQLFCDERCFNEGDGKMILEKTPEGIEYMLKSGANGRITKAVRIARILVFQETLKKRMERCKRYQLARDSNVGTIEKIEKGLTELINFLKDNDIDVRNFATDTYLHLTRQMGIKNNLLFLGPPSTGKTMIMDSLVRLHYNFERMKSTPSRSFDFASLLNVNACLVDECELTDKHFENWKLLAGGRPLRTEKYKQCHYVENCVLYTCATTPLARRVRAPGADHDINARTIQYNFNNVIDKSIELSIFTWEALWKKYDMEI